MKNNFNPLVSIIIPVYNGSNFMRDAIDSALAQTYKNIEIIVVNDGSTDDTEEIARSYGDKIRYYAKENGGVATALNLAIKKSKGEYISWLSHDDAYYAEKVKKQMQKLNELDEDRQLETILWSNFDLIDENGQVISERKYQDLHNKEMLNHPMYPLLNGLIHGCTLLIPRQCFDDVAYFDENLKTTQDYDLWVKMFPKYDLMFMDEVFVKSHIHPAQSSKKIDGRAAELGKLWTRLIDSVSDEQKIEINGSVLNFYVNTYEYVKLTKRSNSVENTLFMKIELLLKDEFNKRTMVIANLATYPARIKSLQKTVESILFQVDILNVYLNDYDEIPHFLDDPRINCVLSKDAKGNLKDNGKFYFLDKVPKDSYYFTIDDDIIYPKDYVQKLIKKLEKYENKAVVGVHGIIFHEEFIDFMTSRSVVHFCEKLKNDLEIPVLGTGTVAFQRNILSELSLQDFCSVGMADLWLAAKCKEEKIPCISIARDKTWLKKTNEEQGQSLWEGAHQDHRAQNDIISQYKLWELSDEVLKTYRFILEMNLCQHRDLVERKNTRINRLTQRIALINSSKSFRVVDLLARSLRNPKKLLTLPINFVHIFTENIENRIK